MNTDISQICVFITIKAKGPKGSDMMSALGKYWSTSVVIYYKISLAFLNISTHSVTFHMTKCD